MSRQKIEALLVENGYRIVRYSKHVIWSNGVDMIVIPHHRQLKGGLAHSIIKKLRG